MERSGERDAAAAAHALRGLGEREEGVGGVNHVVGAELAGGGADMGIPVVVVKRSTVLAKRAKLTVALQPVHTPTENVIGVIHAGAGEKLPGVVVIGAHLDHLGMGGGSNALDPKVHAVHNGADDNASGVAALLEVARTLGAKQSQLSRDVYFVAFSGEEEGDLGSAFYVKQLSREQKQSIQAMINMDTLGLSFTRTWPR